MRPRLLLSLAAVALVTVPAYAKGKPQRLSDLNCTIDEIAKFNGISWVCASDETGPASPTTPYAVLDADGDEVGEMLSVNFADFDWGRSLDSLGALVALDLEALVSIQGKIRVQVDESGLRTPETGVYFESVDCTGSALRRQTTLPPGVTEVPPPPDPLTNGLLNVDALFDLDSFWWAVIVNAEDGSKRLYQADLTTQDTYPFPLSRLSNGACTLVESEGFTLVAFDTDLIIPNLEAFYPSPYTLVRR